MDLLFHRTPAGFDICDAENDNKMGWISSPEGSVVDNKSCGFYFATLGFDEIQQIAQHIAKEYDIHTECCCSECERSHEKSLPANGA